MSEPALSTVFVHLYGPVIGRVVAELLDAQPDQRIHIVVDSHRDPVFRGGLLSPQGAQSTTDAEEEPEDPLPVVDFVGPGVGRPIGDADVIVAIALPRRTTQIASEPPDILGELEPFARVGSKHVAVLVLPAGSIGSRKPDVRAALLALGSITDIVFSPRRAVLPGAHTSSMQWAVTRLELGQPRSSTKLASLDRTDGGTAFEASLDPQNPWTFAGLDPERATRIAAWARDVRAAQLTTVAEVNPRRDLAGPEIRQLTGRDLNENGLRLVDEELEPSPGPHRQSGRGATPLQAGDVVGRSIGRPSWVVIEAENLPLAADPTRFVVLEPKNITPSLLRLFLESEIAQLQLGSTATNTAGVERLHPRQVAEILVPPTLNGPDPAEAIRRLQESCDALLGALRGQAESVFSQRNSAVAELALAEVRRDAVLAESLLHEVRDARSRARKTLPHPIARVVRRLQLAEEDGNPREAYDELLSLAETTVVLLGATFAAYECEAEAGPHDEAKAWTMALTHRGASYGHWLALARKGAESARRSGDNLGGLAQAMSTNAPLPSALGALIERRNDDAHGGAPRTPYEFQVRFDEMSPLVLDVLEGLSAFVHGEFFISETLQFERPAGYTIRGRDLRGDHPDYAPWQRQSDAPLVTGAIHVSLGDRTFALDPYCQLIACALCLREELYYPDKVAGTTLRMRSLERGHRSEVTDPDLVGTLLSRTGD